MEYLTHIARDNERWDTIAAKYFGAAFLYPQIIAANAHLLNKPKLEAGDAVKVPVLENARETSQFTKDEDVPPWNR